MATEPMDDPWARLKTGEVIVLKKDCECVIHDGPHWLHMDDLDKRLNAPLRARAMQGESLAFHAYAEAELRRLDEKRRNMERQHIVEIIREKTQ
jgi:hypothetical protein